MELPQIGQQCHQENCQQLDFLPLQCKCGKIFCSEHYNQHVQKCVHIDNQATDLRRIEGVSHCSHPECNVTGVILIPCEKCKQIFCVKHRHVVECAPKDEKVLQAEKERYLAPVRQFNEAKSAVDQQLDSSLNEAKKKEKNKSMAIKLQLMRIKNKATGLKTIPTTDRVYFNVTNPQNQKSWPVFVAKTWTVGRTIDAIAAECKLQNNNHKSTEKKLRLFKSDTKHAITTNVSASLDQLLNGGNLIDGETLIIDYVNDSCEQLE